MQALGALAITTWAMATTGLIFLAMKYTIGIRMSKRDEILGADWTEHNVSLCK